MVVGSGEEERIEKAKKVLTGGLIGLILIIFSFAIATFVLNSLIDITGGGGDGTCAEACDSGFHCCRSACVPITTSCNPIIPPDSFYLTSTIPNEGAPSVIRNVVIRYNFNTGVNGAT